jgi:hypothetical protein
VVLRKGTEFEQLDGEFWHDCECTGYADEMHDDWASEHLEKIKDAILLCYRCSEWSWSEYGKRKTGKRAEAMYVSATCFSTCLCKINKLLSIHSQYPN